MRYDSLLNSKKWPSDRPKGSATPCFLPTLSVLLLCFLPNHPFSNLDFSGLGQPIFLKFHFAVSKCSKFNNWPTFSRSINDLIHFRPHQTLCYFLAFWVYWPQPTDLYILEQISIISWRTASCNTSFERGHSGLSYDPKIVFNAVQITKKPSHPDRKRIGPLSGNPGLRPHGTPRKLLTFELITPEHYLFNCISTVLG